jgi:ribosome-associated translation inhibitor RaiA/cold shock CspA family protein
MQVPLKVVFRDVEPSPALEARIHERAARLEQFYDRITSCEVAVEEPHRHHHKGNLFAIRLRIWIPGGVITIKRAGPQDHAHEDPYVALRDAFDAAERKLEDAERRRDHRAKVHEVPPHGKLARIFPQDGYGFVETSDGLEVYFHENSVVDANFADLEIGDEVRLERLDNESENGPQATMVRPIGKHHLVGRDAG